MGTVRNEDRLTGEGHEAGNPLAHLDPHVTDHLFVQPYHHLESEAPAPGIDKVEGPVLALMSSLSRLRR